MLLEIDLLLKLPIGVWFVASDYGSCKYLIVLETAIKFIQYLHFLAIVGEQISGTNFINTSKDAEDPNTSSEITPAVIQVSQNPFSDLRAIIRTSGRKATEVDRLITSLETSSVLADQDKRLLNKICSTYLFANYGKKV